jgi:hypothetical protein
VVVAAGRRIDAPGAPERFPLRHRDRVRAALAACLAASRPVVQISSAACGADLLALEAAGELGIRRRIILPFDVGRFRAVSVVDRPGDWGPLFDAVIASVAAAGDLVVLDGGEGDAAYDRVNRAMLAEGEARAAGGLAKVALVAWDGVPRGPDDLTDHFRADAIAAGWRVEDVPTR